MVNWGKYDLAGGNDGNLTLAGDLTFRSGSHTLSTSGKATLDKVAKAIGDSSANHVRVEGHTDSDPISKSGRKYNDNLHLSVMRAHAVAAYLISKGIPEVGVNPRNPDYQLLARAFGCHAVRPDSLDGFADAITNALGADVPTLIEVRQDAPYL